MNIVNAFPATHFKQVSRSQWSILNSLTERGDHELHPTCLGCDGTGVPLVDAHFVVVSIPAIAAGPKERKAQRSGLVGVYGNVDKINPDSSRR